MKDTLKPFLLGCGLVIFLLFAAIASIASGVIGSAGDYVSRNFGLQATTDKYERFHDTVEALNSKKSNIDTFYDQLKETENQLGSDRSKWPMLSIQSYNQRSVELRGMIANYNNVASQYNADAKKFTHGYARSHNLPEHIPPYKR